jgi:hypothetical protein
VTLGQKLRMLAAMQGPVLGGWELELLAQEADKLGRRADEADRLLGRARRRARRNGRQRDLARTKLHDIKQLIGRVGAFHMIREDDK